VNLCETEALKAEFSSRGFETTEDESIADIYVVNSCTVTAVSDKKTRQTLNTLRKSHPNAVIVLTGCYPQAFKSEANAMPNVDIVTGTKDRKSVVALVEKYLKSTQRVVSIEDYAPSDKFESIPIGEFSTKTRGFVKVQDGCNRFCTYCIIPYARGRLRSKPLEDIQHEVESLVHSGHKEIVLVGINLMFYGVEFGTRLVDAVEICAKVQGVERIRLGSLEPEVITDEDLLRLSKVEQFCPQFHLSLQSGCDKTLHDMNRAYTSQEYFELVQKVRETFPNCAITTDVMVGFPNETEEDFQESLAFVESIKFAKVHTFPYSRRSGTPADRMSNQLTKAEKHRRAKLMAEVAQRSQVEFLQSQVGRVVPVLFELENEDNFHHGYTPNYTLVKIPREFTEKSLRKSIFYVKIEEYKDDYCIGSIVSS
jgi:threonylcarbamoyladenosine tRNA methylthiotransferase MtaB